MTDISIEPGLNLRFPKDGFSLDFLTHFNINAPVNFGIDLALYSQQQEGSQAALRVDINLDLDIGSDFPILDFSVKRLVIVNEPWFAQAEIRLTFWDLELHANIIHTNDWQQIEFNFDGDLIIFPQFLRISKMAGILQKVGDSGLLIHLNPTVEFCGNVQREFTAVYDTTGECSDMKFRMRDTISIADMLSALCLQNSAQIFRSSFMEPILDTSVMNLEVDYSDCEQSTILRTSAVVALPMLTSFQMNFASDSSDSGGWYFEGFPENLDWNFLKSGLLSNFDLGDLSLHDLYLGFGHEMAPPNAPCSVSDSGIFFAGTLQIPDTDIWGLLRDAIGQDKFEVCGEYTESLRVSTILEPRQVLGNSFEIDESKFIMDTGAESLAVLLKTDIQMWWDERWEMHLFCEWSPDGWSMTYRWPNTATFDAWFVELGVSNIAVSVYDDSSYEFSAEAWLDEFLRFTVDASDSHFHLKLLEPSEIHIRDFIDMFFDGMGMQIPGLDEIVKTTFLNFQVENLEIYCTSGTQWNCIPLGQMDIFGMEVNTEDYVKVAYDSNDKPVYYMALDGVDLLEEFGLGLIVDVLPSTLEVEFILAMDDISGGANVFNQVVEHYPKQGFNFFVKLSDLGNEAFPWNLLHEITTFDELTFAGAVSRTSFEIAAIIDMDFDFGDFECHQVQPYMKYVVQPYYMEIGLRGIGSWDDVNGKIEMFFRFPSSQYGFLFSAEEWSEPFGIPGVFAEKLEVGAALTGAVPSEIYGSAKLRLQNGGGEIFVLLWLNVGVAPPVFAYDFSLTGVSVGQAFDLLSSLVDGMLPFDLDLSDQPMVKGLLDSFSFGDVRFALSTASQPVEVGSYLLHPGFEFDVNNVNIFDGLIDIPRVFMKCTSEISFDLEAGCQAKMAIRVVDLYFLKLLNGMLDFRMNMQGMPRFGFKFTVLKLLRIFTVDVFIAADTSGSGSAQLQLGLSWDGEERCNMQNGKRNGDNGFCSPQCPCNWGEGSCNNDDLQCSHGLVCRDDVASEFGFQDSVSLCFPADNAPLPAMNMDHHDFWISMSAADLYGFSGFAFNGIGINFGKAIGKLKDMLIDQLVMPVVDKFKSIYNLIKNPSFGGVKDFIDAWKDRPNQRRELKAKHIVADLQTLVLNLRRQYAECQVSAIVDPTESVRCWMIMLQLRAVESAVTKTVGRRALIFSAIGDAIVDVATSIVNAIESAWNWLEDLAKDFYHNLKGQVESMINRFDAENNNLWMENSGGIELLFKEGRIHLRYGGTILGFDLGHRQETFCVPVDSECVFEMAEKLWDKTKHLFRLDLLSKFEKIIDFGRRELIEELPTSAYVSADAALGAIPELKAKDAPAILTRGECQSSMDLPHDQREFQQSFFKEMQRPFWLKDRSGKSNLFVYSANCGSHVRVGAATIVYKNVQSDQLESHGTKPTDNPRFHMHTAIKHSDSASTGRRSHLKHVATFVENIENIM